MRGKVIVWNPRRWQWCKDLTTMGRLIMGFRSTDLIVFLQHRNLAQHVHLMCPDKSAANILLNTEFIHYCCWVFRRQDEQNQHPSPTDGMREGQLQAYSVLHKACMCTWDPLPSAHWHFQYTDSRKTQLSELTVTPQIPLLCTAQLEKTGRTEGTLRRVQRCNLSCGGKGSYGKRVLLSMWDEQRHEFPAIPFFFLGISFYFFLPLGLKSW